MDQYQNERLDSLDPVQEERQDKPSIEVSRASVSQYRSTSPQTVLQAPILNGTKEDMEVLTVNGSVTDEESLSRSSSTGNLSNDAGTRRVGRSPNVAMPRSPGHRPEQPQGYFSLWQPNAYEYHSSLTDINTPSGSSRSQSANVSSSSLQGLDEATSYAFQQGTTNRPSAERFESASSNASTATAIRNLRRTSSHTRSGSQPLMRIVSKDEDDHPGYPIQSHAALQTFPRPRTLRTRSSHPSQHSLYSDSATSNNHMRERSTPAQSSRTTSNTPASSPGLFSPAATHSSTAELDDQRTYLASIEPPEASEKLNKLIDTYTGNKIFNQYEILAELGRGEYGKVKLARDLERQRKVAIKIVQRFSKQRRLARLSTPEEKVKKEVAILKKARHPNVVALLEVIDDPSYKKVYIVLEFVELGEIVWRKQGLNAVIEVERRRLEREKKGIPETVESMESDQDIVRNAELKHLEHEKKRAFILAKEEELRGIRPAKKLNPSRVRSPSTASSQIVESQSWSLELGGEPQDDDEAATGYDTPHAPASQGLPTSPNDVDQSPSSVSSRRDVTLAGSMYGPYIPDPYEERRSSVGSSPISMHSDAWAPADEESAWVPCLTLSEIRSTFRDAVLGLEYLHFQGIIHRDLKPANLLWTADRRTKISDFGVSYLGRPIRNDDENGAAEEDATELHDPKELSRTVGTPAFYAPELCSTDPTEEPPKITGQIDVWALGVTLYCMLFGRVPFYDDNDYAMYQKICKEDVFISRKRLKAVEDPAPTPAGSQGQLARSMNSNKRLPYELVYEPIEEDLVNLLQRLLTKDPTSRITLKDVKRHPWVLGEIPNHSTWVEETDPSKQSAGKKIEVSDQDVAAAISKNNFIGRAMSTVKRLVMGAASSRNRATSTATSVGTEPKSLSSSSTLGKVSEGKGTSKANEMIFTATLKASREGEHPLAQSVTTSPELKEGVSYFATGPITNPHAVSTGAIHKATDPKATDPKEARPNAPDRSQSNAESVKTLKGPAPHILPNLVPPPNTPEPYPSVLDQFSSGFGGLLGRAGGRLTHSMKSKGGKRNASSDRSSSVSLSSIPDEDAHGEPSLAVSTAFASGQVNPPAALQEGSAPPTSPERHSLVGSISTHSRSPQNRYDSTPEAFTHAKTQLIRRQNLEEAATKTASRPQSAASFQDECPPSPDDEIFYRHEEEMYKRRQQPQETSMQKSPPSAATISSSDDQFSSGISQSTSHPSIPSVVSGASSLSADDYLLIQDQSKLKSAPAPTAVPPMMRTADTVKAVSSTSVGKGDEDEAAWNGDNDDDECSDEEDEGLSFGPSHGKKPLI